jgi:hypothetical protein
MREAAGASFHDTWASLADPTSDCELRASDCELRADGIQTDHAAFSACSASGEKNFCSRSCSGHFRSTSAVTFGCLGTCSSHGVIARAVSTVHAGDFSNTSFLCFARSSCTFPLHHESTSHCCRIFSFQLGTGTTQQTEATCDARALGKSLEFSVTVIITD